MVGTSVVCRGSVECHASVVELGARGVMASGLPFLDHMLDQLTAHAQLGLSLSSSASGVQMEPEKKYPPESLVQCGSAEQLEGELTEAAGEALGAALRTMLGPLQAELPAARFLAPLDEGLAEVVLQPNVDSKVEPSLHYALAPFGSQPPAGRKFVGDLRLELLSGFWGALAKGLNATLTVVKVRGENAHHIVESSFKAFSRALRAWMDARPSSKRPRDETDSCCRRTSHERSTKETKISLTLNLDSKKSGTIATGLKTLDAMVSELASASGIELEVQCQGDLFIDDHHSTEDVAIALGQCLHQALGSKAGCNRMAWAAATEGNERVEVALDLSNRPHFQHDLAFDVEMVRAVNLLHSQTMSQPCRQST